MARAKTLEVNLTEKQKKVLSDFEEYLGANSRKSITTRRHNYCVRKFIEFAGSSFDFNTATRQDIMRVMSKVNASDLAIETKRKMVCSIKLLYKHLKGDDEEYPREVSWLKTSSDTKRKLPEELLTEDEVNSMINFAASIRDRAIISFMFESGARIGEILNMKIKDIDMHGDLAHIQLNGKTGMRKIPVRKCIPYLSNYLDTLNKSDPSKALWLDANNLEKPITGSCIAKVLKTTAKRAGIKKRIYCHLMRHSSATLAANYMTNALLKEYYGWSFRGNTEAVYLHMSGKNLDDAVKSSYSDYDAVEKPKPPSYKLCPKCHERNGTAAIHCQRCGSNLNWQAEASQQMTQENDAKIVIDFFKKNPKLMGKFFRLMEKEV